MRLVMLGLCLSMVACADGGNDMASGPVNALTGPTAVNATGGSELPLHGRLDASETVDGALHVLTGTGVAAHLGRFTVTAEFTVVPPPVSTGAGTATWTAASGDQLYTVVTGQAVVTFPTARIAETHAITGGTGRFASASGTMALDRSLNLVTLESSATISGSINLRD